MMTDSPISGKLSVTQKLPDSPPGCGNPDNRVYMAKSRDDEVSITASTLLEDWETAQYGQSLSSRTVTERMVTVRQMAAWCGIPPHLAGDREVSRWLAKGGTWSTSTRHTYYTRLNAWFSWLTMLGYRPDNPMTRIKPPKRPKYSPRPISDEHLPRLFAAANRRRTRAMLLIALCQGFRAMEIAKIHSEDIDRFTGEIRVVGKGGKVSVVPLHPRIRELAEFMPDGYWFPSFSDPHRPVAGKAVSRTLSDLFKRAGVIGTGHATRHWFGTSLIEKNVDLVTTQELMRHESVSSTQIYVRVSKRRKRKGIDRIDPVASSRAAARKKPRKRPELEP
ncbi:tyrosine-type recombinase/integrase [Nocardia takedensis]|uniref:tyrosine-type recombinase/integrase n=1 Tax=Nocardia takedensis TaxID=259390 RepID=UPI003F761D3E